MAEYDFETRMSDSVLKERLPDFDGDEAVLLNAPSTIEDMLRTYGKQVLDWYGLYLSGKIDAIKFQADFEAEARRLQAILYGGSPKTHWPTAWHSPDQLGRHILSYGPLAESPDDAVFGLLGHFTKALIAVVDFVGEKPDGEWQAEMDSLIENYMGILLGYPKSQD